MNFADKKKAYEELRDHSHLCCDRELLEKKAPKSKALRINLVNKVVAQQEILWALLDVATVDEIKAYRKPAKKTPEELIRLLELINSGVPDTKESIKEADDSVCKLLDTLEKAEIELTDEQKDLVSAYKGLLSSALIEIREKEAALEVESIKTELISLDLKAASQSKLAQIARILKIESANKKKATLVPLLEAYKANLPKQSEGTGSEMIPVEAHLEETAAELAEAKKKADPDPA